MKKPSLRTKVSFQVGIEELGGYSLYLGPQEVGLGGREPVCDVARVLSGYVDCIIARVFSHEQLAELAEYSSAPGHQRAVGLGTPLPDHRRPVDHSRTPGGTGGAEAGVYRRRQQRGPQPVLGGPPLGVSFAIASPDEYRMDEASLEAAHQRASEAEISTLTAPAEAVKGADVVYTDVWTSMGDEAETAARQRTFQGYTVDAELLAKAKPGAAFMHDMPAHYGEEVAEGMLEHPQSLAYQQANNRLHGQKALLEFLFGQD